MFTGLASPSHLIVVLAIVLLLFGAKRIPELAKGLGTGIKEFREGVSTSEDADPEDADPEEPEGEKTLSGARAESEAGNGTVRAHADQRRP
jgi:sec-independent protein translocase protein TatA